MTCGLAVNIYGYKALSYGDEGYIKSQVCQSIVFGEKEKNNAQWTCGSYTKVK